MTILEKASKMLESYPLCDNCLGRQFALLGRDMKNAERGKIIKVVFTLQAHALVKCKVLYGFKALKTTAEHGISKMGEEILHRTKNSLRFHKATEMCFLCQNKFRNIVDIAKNALDMLQNLEYQSFLIGIELPFEVEEREDEFRAKFGINYGESMRKEFGRILGKKIVKCSGKTVDFFKPDVVVLINPFTNTNHLQINPLYIAGRYKKLMRGIPQSKWFCSHCSGRGCKQCNLTGKMYSESVEEIIGKPVLDVSSGGHTSFHASGREDIDALMLGNGRPFVIEISKPRKRYFDVQKLESNINSYSPDKVQVFNLRIVDKTVVRQLKKGESAQKEYRVVITFEKTVTKKDLHLLEVKLTNILVKQKTPLRVLHRRADLTRERYIYRVTAKKLMPKKAEMRILCQGGLYIKELVTGDAGRTKPSVSEILNMYAKPVQLDVLNVIIED